MVNKVKKIFIIVLNYNNAEDTLECVKSLDFLGEEYQIVLVDNGSDITCIKEIESNIDERIKLITTNENLGYAEGNNVGIRYAIEHGAEIIVVLNNDVIANVDSFNKSIKILKETEQIAIIGPTILEIEGNLIQSAGADIDYLNVYSKLIKHKEKFCAQNRLIECDYVGGACMIFKSNLPQIIGYIPDDYFLFFEETEWCIKAQRAGYKVVCNMNSYVRHKGSASINKVSGMSRYYFERNRARFIVKNAPSKFVKANALMLLFLKAIIKGIFRDKKNFELIRFYQDGIKGKFSKF